MDLTKIAVSIVGDASHYLRSVNMVIRETQRMTRVVTASMTGSSGIGFLAGLSLMPLMVSANLATTAIERTLRTTVSLGSEAIKIGMEFERTATAFNVLVGDAEKGRNLFREINQLALRNPFTTQQMLKSGQMLLGMGSQAQDVVPQLERLSNLAVGDPAKLSRLVYDFGEVMAYNRLDSRFLRMFATMGVGVKDFAKASGMSMAEFKAAMHNGEIGADVMIKTINQLTSAGGRFAGMNEQQMKTVSGAWSNLVETVQVLTGGTMMKIFERTGLAGTIQEVADAIREFGSSRTEGFIKFFEDLSRGLAPAKAVLMLAKELFGGWTELSGEKIGEGMVEFLFQAVTLAKELELRIRIAMTTLEGWRKQNLPPDHFLVRLDESLKKLGFAKFMDEQQDKTVASAERAWKEVFSPTTGLGYRSNIESMMKEEQRRNPDKAQDTLSLYIQEYEVFQDNLKELQKYGKTLTFLDPNATLREKRSFAFDLLRKEREARGLDPWDMEGPGAVGATAEKKPWEVIDDKLASLRKELNDLPESARKQFDQFINNVKNARRNEELSAIWNPLRYMPGGGGPLLRSDPRLRPEATEYAMKTIQDMQKGITPYDRFLNKMNLAQEAYQGPYFGKSGVVGPHGMDLSGMRLGAELTDKQRDYAVAKNYLELSQSIRHMIDSSLPRAMARDTAEAQDVINRSSQRDLSIQEEILRNVQIAADLSAQERDYLAEIANTLLGMRKDGPGVVGAKIGGRAE
jgi:hypothetical protein